MTLAYTTELTQAQWELLEYLLPPAKNTGRPRTVDLMSVVQAGGKDKGRWQISC